MGKISFVCCPSMLCILIIILSIVLLVASKTGDPPAFCDDPVRGYSTMQGSMLSNIEFPLPIFSSTVSGLADTVSTFAARHPCYFLTEFNNYKLQTAGILDYGDFSTDFCQRRCTHVMEVNGDNCGIRRPPAAWVAGFSAIIDTSSYNCSNWNIPLTPKGLVQDEFYLKLYYTQATFEQNVISLDSMKALSIPTMKGFMLSVQLTDQNATSNIQTTLERILDLNPGITHFVLEDELAGFVDQLQTIKIDNIPYYFNKINRIESLALNRITSSDWTQQLHRDMTTIRAMQFSFNDWKSLPSWITLATNLQMLTLTSIITPGMDISLLNNLSNLEHFAILQNQIQELPVNFLEKSTKLISLTIQCNTVSSLPIGIFDKFKELRFLTIAGNRINSMPDALFSSLNNLLSLDVQQAFWSSGQYSINNMGNLYACTDGGTAVNKTYELSTLPNLPNPSELLVLDIGSNPKSFAKVKANYLEKYTSLEFADVSNLDLTTLQGLGLETLCDLESITLFGNPLSAVDWFPEEFTSTLIIDTIVIGQNNFTTLPPSLIANIKRQPSLFYLLQIHSSYSPAWTDACTLEALYFCTQFNYSIVNQNCTTIATNLCNATNDLVAQFMDSKCFSWKATS